MEKLIVFFGTGFAIFVGLIVIELLLWLLIILTTFIFDTTLKKRSLHE